jgi:hypothetical protein
MRTALAHFRAASRFLYRQDFSVEQGMTATTHGFTIQIWEHAHEHPKPNPSS